MLVPLTLKEDSEVTVVFKFVFKESLHYLLLLLCEHTIILMQFYQNCIAQHYFFLQILITGPTLKLWLRCHKAENDF